MTKRRTNFTPFDAADHLDSPEDIAAYLEVAAESKDPALVARAKETVARAKLRPFDPANYLTTDEAITSYRASVIEDGDPGIIAGAEADIATALARRRKA